MKNITIDAKNKKLGRLASKIALILQGKDSPKYEPRLEGDNQVIIKNIDKIEISGKKFKDKVYYHHTTQIGHLKKQTLQQIWEKNGPAEVLRRAVMGMLPKNKLQAKRIKKLVIE
ncbi:MAG TPA: 50S ribosomal protein L13 [Candidatus Wolfebacteria bacterium]|nr:50S ribosomal protein L13 [Candidatus Wolfebacteria bacterium]